MCEASKIAEDWVIKGFHIHVNGIELAVLSDHEGGIAFRPFFSSTNGAKADAAIKEARGVCLANPATRKAWIAKLKAANAYMYDYSGEYSLASRARGRMFEFKMLRIAIERWELKNGKN
jgi:hypothetical protein